MKGLTPWDAARRTAARSWPMLLRAPPPRITMPPMPILAQRRPASGSGAGTLQKQSCAASRRSDHEASSEGALGLGDVDGDGEPAVGRCGGRRLLRRLDDLLRRAPERAERRQRDDEETRPDAEVMACHGCPSSYHRTRPGARTAVRQGATGTRRRRRGRPPSPPRTRALRPACRSGRLAAPTRSRRRQARRSARRTAPAAATRGRRCPPDARRGQPTRSSRTRWLQRRR